MYKVFFKDRIIFFESDFSDNFRNKTGLFYRHRSLLQLSALIKAFYDLREIPRLYLFHDDISFLWSEFKSLFHYIPAAGGLVKNPDNKYLIIKRNEIWDLPKGKMEKGESFEETALREVSEECGLDSLILGDLITTTYHTYKIDGKPVLKETKWYNMMISENQKTTPQLKEGITDIKWVSEGGFGFIHKNTFASIKEVLEAKEIL
jgi:NUDIX domain